MDNTEFRKVSNYLSKLTAEKGDDLHLSEYKSKEFYSVIPLLLKKYPNAYVRDYLDIDGTFALAFESNYGQSFTGAISIYLDTVQLLEQLTYSRVKNTGLISLDAGITSMPLYGFWILLG